MIEYSEYHRLKYIVEEHLLDFLPDVDRKSMTLYESAKYSLNAQGKRIRPILLLAACEMAGGDIMQALPFACAVEYIHSYSLIHDDLPAMDDDDLRRGLPTNHVVYGEATAILAGDALLNAAYEAMIKDMQLYYDQPTALKNRVSASYVIAKESGCLGLVGGQMADLEAEGKQVSPELLDYIHVNKTAALIEASIVAGAYLGGGNSALVSALRNYAGNVGLAFQIADDILDVEGDEVEIGKKTQHDMCHHKATYPSVHGLEKSKERLAALTDSAIAALSGYRQSGEFFVEMARYLANRTK
ncbi:MAG: polyprenyl synthetase family protein [Clostridiales Family XIII bacterium]|jgi:geranylgeranyl diphosphate synthase type II|nr:polyprenyl synthetase family protein [Clostridiales Family XIII bacterium]